MGDLLEVFEMARPQLLLLFHYVINCSVERQHFVLNELFALTSMQCLLKVVKLLLPMFRSFHVSHRGSFSRSWNIVCTLSLRWRRFSVCRGSTWLRWIFGKFGLIWFSWVSLGSPLSSLTLLSLWRHLLLLFLLSFQGQVAVYAC